VSVEEIGSEPPRSGRRGYGGILLAVVVAGAVGWLLLNGGSDGTATPRPTPTSSVSEPSPSASTPDHQRPGIADAQLHLGEVCDPPRPTKRTFDVRFTLVNPSPARLLLLRVVPGLPLGGLTLERTLITSGGCQDPSGPVLTQPTVAAGGSVVVVFRFRQPTTCPKALPVQADVTSRVFDVSQSGQRVVLPVYPDLGTLDFTTCP
jgi:hypothetical protein